MPILNSLRMGALSFRRAADAKHPSLSIVRVGGGWVNRKAGLTANRFAAANNFFRLLPWLLLFAAAEELAAFLAIVEDVDPSAEARGRAGVLFSAKGIRE